MATRLDVTERAYRLLGLKAEDQALSADEAAFGVSTLESLFAEIEAEHEPAWDLDDIPAGAVPALSLVLAADVAPAYGRPAPVSRGVAWVRLMAFARPDERDVVEASYF
jgi:hypothetical protein